MAEGEKIIGIDLGTTNSVVAVMEGSEVKVIPNQEGNRLTPSVVAFTDKGDVLVGDPAKRQAITNPRRTVYSIKRFMGRRHKEVASEEKLVPYKIVGGPDELVKVDIDGKLYTPPEISAMILRKLKEAAEAYLGHTVRKAVITVPAYFNDAQRQATIDAAQIAGFDTEWEIEDPKTGKKSKQRMRIINEPTAASLAYGLDKKKNEKIAVFDLGGGTFDISVLDVGDGVFQVKSTNGDTHLGGDDFDQVLIDYIADEFKKENGIDLRKDQMALQRLKEAAERAKKDLSQADDDRHQPAVHHGRRQRAEAPAAVADAAEVRAAGRARWSSAAASRCMQGPAGRRLKPRDIDEIVMVGGMTRMPRVQQLVKDIFGKEGHRGVNPDEVVAIGAAIQGRSCCSAASRRAAARRDAAVAGHRDPGRRADPADRAQHDDPDDEEADLLDGGGQPAGGDDPRLPGREPDRREPEQPAAGRVQPRGHSAGAARHAADRGDLRPRRQRHPQRHGQGPGHRQGAEDPHRVLQRPQSVGGRADAARRPSAHADEDRKQARADRRAQQGGPDGLPDGEAAQGQRRQDRRVRQGGRSRRPSRRSSEREKADDVRAIRQAVAELEQASHAMAQHLYKQGAAGGAAADRRPALPRTATARAARKTSSTPSSRSRSKRVAETLGTVGRTGDCPQRRVKAVPS